MRRKYAMPYRVRGTISYTAFRMAEKGTTDSEIMKFTKKMKGNYIRIIKKLKGGVGGGFLWDVEEWNGRLKILNIRIAPKLPENDSSGSLPSL